MPAEPLDDDRDEIPPYRGPGRRKPPATGPVVAAYADSRIDEPCPDCQAPAHSFCQHGTWHPNGTPRITPCGGRRNR